MKRGSARRKIAFAPEVMARQSQTLIPYSPKCAKTRIKTKPNMFGYPKGKNKGAVPKLKYTSKAYRAYLTAREPLIALRIEATLLLGYSSVIHAARDYWSQVRAQRDWPTITSIYRWVPPRPYDHRIRVYNMTPVELRLLNELFVVTHPPTYVVDPFTGTSEQLIQFPPYDE